MASIPVSDNAAYKLAFIAGKMNISMEQLIDKLIELGVNGNEHYCVDLLFAERFARECRKAEEELK